MPRGQYKRGQRKERVLQHLDLFAVVAIELGMRPKILAVFNDGGDAVKLADQKRAAKPDDTDYHVVHGEFFEGGLEHYNQAKQQPASE